MRNRSSGDLWQGGMQSFPELIWAGEVPVGPEPEVEPRESLTGLKVDSLKKLRPKRTANDV